MLRIKFKSIKGKALIKFSFLFLIPVLVFVLTKGNLPNLSELNYIEYSILGEKSGSLIPASCDSYAPFTSPTSAGGTAGSHFNGDCVTTCPNGYGSYDPYFNPGAVGCCTNGATNPSACNACPSGKVYYGGSCVNPVCANGAIWSACNTCPAGKTFVGGTCQNQVWTAYCTGSPSWQVWEYDNGDTTAYRNTGASCNPTPSISASPVNIPWNTASTISWSSANTSSCTASGAWSGAKGVSGSQGTGNLTSTQNYNIYCTNLYSQNSSVVSATVNVCNNRANNPTACTTCPVGQTFVGGICQNQIWTKYCTGGSDINGNYWQVWEYDNGDTTAYRNTGASCNPTPTISANPMNVTWGYPSTLTWSSSNSVSCTASNGWSGAKATNGSQSTGNLTTTTTFGISCTNSYAQTSPIISVTVTSGTFDTPTWVPPTYVAPTGDIIPNSCTIATGASSCSMNVAWSTTNPPGLVEVRRNYAGGSVVTTGASGNNSYVFPYSATPYRLDLYDAHRNVLLDNANYTATCAAGGWDSIGGVCANPIVTSVTVIGQYYSTPGGLRITCSGANNYIVRNADTNVVVSSGSYSGGTVTAPVITSGNYSIRCGHGDYYSPAVVRYYNAPPPPLPIVSLTASPRTITKNANTTLRWDIQFPVNACTLTAKSVCTNNQCSAAQTSAALALTTKLRTENTDTSDPSGSRLMTTAIRTIAPGHIDTDWKALGRKTFKVANTMDITLDCGSGRSATTRIQVTSSNEQ